MIRGFQEEKTFRIPTGVPAWLHQITDSMDKNSVRNIWKSQVLVGNSVGRDGDPVGDLGEVRYVMISTKDDTIIPIAISDEHQTGYDVMWSVYKKKYKINPDDYVSINAWGNSYISLEGGMMSARKFAQAARKFLSYGGTPTLQVKFYEPRNLSCSIADIVELSGDPEAILKKFKPRKGKLFSAGQDLITLTHEFHQAVEAVTGGLPKTVCNKIVALLKTYLETIVDRWPMELLYKPGADAIMKEARDIAKGGDIDELQGFIFGYGNTVSNEVVAKELQGFAGVKNYLHSRIKSARDDSWKSGELTGIFGDLLTLDEAFRNA